MDLRHEMEEEFMEEVGHGHRVGCASPEQARAAIQGFIQWLDNGDLIDWDRWEAKMKSYGRRV